LGHGITEGIGYFDTGRLVDVGRTRGDKTKRGSLWLPLFETVLSITFLRNLALLPLGSFLGCLLGGCLLRPQGYAVVAGI
jgi:hypothetical protein